MNFFQYASPSTFYHLAGKCIPWTGWTAGILAVVGLYVGFFVAPTDFQQGEAYRIIFIHVPAAWMGMLIYLAMAFWAAVGLALNARLPFMMMRALAPTGAMLTFVSLWTGAVWGKPMWGTWWVWDARLTSTLILLFLYIGTMALWSAIEDVRRSDRAGALLTLIGVVNVPIILFSVVWWNTLHQGSTVGVTHAPKMEATMLQGLLIMTAAAWLYAITATLVRVRRIILERERKTQWVNHLLSQES
ncbi:MAG: heme ABC transporter permease CcmC [Serpentinimonas sp.]|jgi:heme exporter protein C|nr:heme ABC transporter permease CcmC [Serpentinimonas sp.]